MTTDLSTHHQPISNIFTWPNTPDAWERYRLTDDQVAFFHEHGYLAGVRLLTDAQVDTLLEQLPALMDPVAPGHELYHEFHSNESSDPARTLFHALGAWRIARGFHDLLWNPAFLMPAMQLLGGSVRFWHDQLFCKPAHHGGVVAWHQDYSYWTRTQPMAHLTCWVGLDDSRTDNGCLHYVPGSHRWPLLPITGLAGDMDEIRTVLNQQQNDEFHPVAAELKRGECAFHHPLMVHGSHENLTDRQRRATVLNVFQDGVKSATDEPLLDGVDSIPSGTTMGGRFFPLLLDSAVTRQPT